MQERDLIELIKACTQPVLGICLGMQLLGRFSEENSGVDLLGIIDQDVPKMEDVGLPAAHGLEPCLSESRQSPVSGDR
jgi:glutamine amidotransferase